MEGSSRYYFHIPLELKIQVVSLLYREKGTFLSAGLVPSARGIRRWCHPLFADVSSLFSKELRLSGKSSLCAFRSLFPPRTEETERGHKLGEKRYCSLPWYPMTSPRTAPEEWYGQKPQEGRLLPPACSRTNGFCFSFLTLEFLSVARFLWEHPQTQAGAMRSTLRGRSHGHLQADAGKRCLRSASLRLPDFLNTVPSTN